MLTASERRIVAALARQIISAEVDERFVDRVDELIARSAPGARNDLRRAITLFNGRLAGFLTTFRPVCFTETSVELRRRRIDAFRNSRLALFRTIYMAIQRLCLACYYSDPRNASAAGYPGPPEIGR